MALPSRQRGVCAPRALAQEISASSAGRSPARCGSAARPQPELVHLVMSETAHPCSPQGGEQVVVAGVGRAAKGASEVGGELGAGHGRATNSAAYRQR